MLASRLAWGQNAGLPPRIRHFLQVSEGEAALGLQKLQASVPGTGRLLRVQDGYPALHFGKFFAVERVEP
jgi:hypothetical protein